MKTVQANPVVMKEINAGIVRNELIGCRSATKKELAERTGLSIVTVNSILTGMLSSGEVWEGESVPSNGGRPSRVYRYSDSFYFALILYGHEGENGDHIKLRVVNVFGEIICATDITFQEIHLQTFEPLIRDMLEQYPRIGAIGFGLPGEEHQGIVTVNDFKHIVGTEFRKYYENCFGLPVLIENDANAATLGFCRRYRQRNGEIEYECVAGLYFPEAYPPGAGIVMKGKIYKGKNNFAGEIARVPLPIVWEDAPFTGKERAEQIVLLSVTVSCVLAPSVLVIHTFGLEKEWQDRIRKSYEKCLKGVFETEIVFSDDFIAEFEEGMIGITLESMRKNMILTEEG